MDHARDLETVLTELGQVTEELLAAPPGDIERRLELRARRDRLRSEAARLRESRQPADDPEALRARIRRLEQRREALRDRRLLGPMGGGGGRGGGGFGDPERIAAINRGILSAGGIEDIDAELAELRRRLAAVRGEA